MFLSFLPLPFISPFLQSYFNDLSLPTYKQHFPFAVSCIHCFTSIAVLPSTVITLANTEKFGTARAKKSAPTDARAVMALETVTFAFSLLL
jgi:hypothetical protein